MFAQSVSNRFARKRTNSKDTETERHREEEKMTHHFFPSRRGTFLLLKMLMRHSLKQAYLHDVRGKKKKNHFQK